MPDHQNPVSRVSLYKEARFGTVECGSPEKFRRYAVVCGPEET